MLSAIMLDPTTAHVTNADASPRVSCVHSQFGDLRINQRLGLLVQTKEMYKYGINWAMNMREAQWQEKMKPLLHSQLRASAAAGSTLAASNITSAATGNTYAAAGSTSPSHSGQGPVESAPPAAAAASAAAAAPPQQQLSAGNSSSSGSELVAQAALQQGSQAIGSDSRSNGAGGAPVPPSDNATVASWQSAQLQALPTIAAEHQGAPNAIPGQQSQQHQSQEQADGSPYHDGQELLQRVA